MKYTKCNEEQFFKIYPPEERQTTIMGANGDIETIKHDRFVCCDSCNSLIYRKPNEEAYLLLEVEGWRSTSLECSKCFNRSRVSVKKYDSKEEELTTDEAIAYLKSDAGYSLD